MATSFRHASIILQQLSRRQFSCSVISRLKYQHHLWVVDVYHPQLTAPICPSWRKVQWYSEQSRRPNFLSQFVENLKQEMEKNKKMKESLKKFREEAEKLEHSDALKKARRKYQAVESEASKSSDVLKQKFDDISKIVHEKVGEVQQSEFAKKAGQVTEELGKSAKVAAENISQKTQKLSKSNVMQSISGTAEKVRKEFDDGVKGKAHMYSAPVKLRKRVEYHSETEAKIIEANTEATGVELHKESRWFQSWQNFRDNNAYVNKVIDWKMRYDESDNPVIRASRLLTDKVSDIMGGLFQKTELSEVLTEICKVDPTFDKDKFLIECEHDIIPNILEAMIRGELEILKDWCYEAPFNVIATPIKQAQQLGYIFDTQVLDIDNVDLPMGKMMEQGPVLVVSFTSQQIVCLRDKKGAVVEGNADKIMRVYYVWVLCRDQSELNPRAAWRLLDLSASSQEQML